MPNLTTSLPLDVYERCKKSGLGWNNLIVMGINSHEHQSQTYDQIKEMQESVRTLKDSMKHYREMYWDLKERVERKDENTGAK